MPSITIRVFEGELTWGQAAGLVDHVTEVVVPILGEAVRSNVWLLVKNVSRRRAHREATRTGLCSSEHSCNDHMV